MELGAKQSHLPFLTALARLKSRFDISMTEDDFIEAGYYIWRQIGNIARGQEVYVAEIPNNLIITLPINCEFVESVTAIEYREMAEHTGMDSSGYKLESERNMTELSPAEDARTSKSYVHGESVNYSVGNGFIKITSINTVGVNVEVKYNAILVGEDGLPLLNDREVEAIAANMALRELEKRMFRGTKVSMEFFKYIKGEADRLMQAGAIEEKISDSAFDKMLDIKVSWDRKTYGNNFNLTI